ncbi:MAG TPA: FtsQ-type POTRA domain-containing protein [Candidatus Dormibacteraeota bacterium]|nr:FtsQ-type POTRA domain-containing protein [Candidatus Dormibacteraeota bacterium]
MKPRAHRPASGPLHAAPISGRRLARQPAHRPRRFGSLDERAHRRARKLGSLALAAVWLAGLIALLVAPVLRVRHVDVSGNRRLTAGQVVAAAGLQHPGSVFLVDPPALEHKLGTATWVRNASVTVQLPDRVRIRVDEWTPVAVYRAAAGRAWYLSDQAVVLGPADGAAAGALLAVDGPAQPQPRAGAAPIDRALLTALVNIQRALPDLIGQDVQSFTIDSCGALTLNSRKGWKGLFGRVNTPEELATLKDKVAALRALAASGDVDFNTVQYVNVMNPAVVAVPKPSPRPGRGAPSPSPSATAAPQPAACH